MDVLTIRSRLQTGLATITVRKKNGDLHIVRCTTCKDLIPSDKLLSRTSSLNEDVDENIICVFDIEANEWGSFSIDSITHMRFFTEAFR